MKYNITVLFLFDTGMWGSDIAQCDVMLGIPTNPEFGSLNVAAAVQLIAYDWRMATGGNNSYGIL
jgi:tRNA/rRNA methyltransferase